MTRFLSLTLVLCVLLLCAAPLCCAAAADAQDETEPVPVLDKDFNLDLATTLIVVICSVFSAVILVGVVILGKRNIRN